MSVEVHHVSKTFGSYVALHDVSLSVATGELVALLGPSGSGKTTLLRIIAGMEVPDPPSGLVSASRGSAGSDAQTRSDSSPSDEGKILFFGEDVATWTVSQRQVGFVFQHYALFKHMSVYENIAFGLRVRPRQLRPSNTEIDQRVRRLLQLIQLEGLGDRFPMQLSGGQRQRVALARALAIEPKILLLDEPFGALDAKVRQKLREWLRQLHETMNTTTILVTHDQEEALEVSDRVVVMNQAQIEQIGTPEEVFHHPASEFVIDFLGSVNVFSGRHLEGDVPGHDLHGMARDDSKMYVRPHELSISRHAEDERSLPARIQRIHRAGAHAKVFLQTALDQNVRVDIPITQCNALSLADGEQVYITPLNTHVFSNDFNI